MDKDLIKKMALEIYLACIEEDSTKVTCSACEMIGAINFKSSQRMKAEDAIQGLDHHMSRGK